MKKLIDFSNSDSGRSLWTSLGLMAVLLLGYIPGPAGSWSSGVASTLAKTGPNAVDENSLMRRYYDPNLSDEDEAFDPFGGFVDAGEGEEELPPGWIPIEDSTCVTYDHEDPFLIYVLKPNHEDILKGASNITNRWGMRDKDYEQEKPAKTFRIALCGASNDMGSGVEVEQNFATLVEERLNRELGGKYFDNYEILNFSVGGYFMLERLWVVEKVAPEFQPDLIICTTLKADRGMLADRLAKRLIWYPSVQKLHYDFLIQSVRKAGIRQRDLAEAEGWTREQKRLEEGPVLHLKRQLKKGLDPLKERLMVECLEELNRFQEESSIPVAAMVLHREPGMRAEDDKDTVWVARNCEEAGLPTLRVYKAYEHETEGMILHPQDRHPSVKAHALLADDIYETMMAHPQIGAMLRGEVQPVDVAHDGT